MNVAVCLPSLEASQLTLIAVAALKRYMLDTGNQGVMFYENLAPISFTTSFPLMQMADCFSFDGTAVATTLATAAKLINCPSPERKLFYVHDLEWTHLNRKSYDYLQFLYGHPDLELVARSESHRKLLERYWGVNAVIDPYLNLAELCLPKLTPTS